MREPGANRGRREDLALPKKPGELVIRKTIYGGLPRGAWSDVTGTVSKIANARQGGERWQVRVDGRLRGR